jgi:hypothetical protein
MNVNKIINFVLLCVPLVMHKAIWENQAKWQLRRAISSTTNTAPTGR